jgi:hypothetical protein
VRLSGVASDQKQRLLVRLMIEDPNLQAVPWEAMCRPQSNRGFLAGAADVLFTRGVNSVDPWQPRELRRSLVVLPVLAIPDRSALEGLEAVLKEHVESGAVELLPAIEGDAARNPVLFERLRSGPSPHVLHFLGHGGFDNQRNPVIRLADDADGEKTLLPIEVFAEELRASFDTMRIVYLQACSGARPGVFASAAELLARSGVDAVVAHLWPVRAEVARAAAQDFYAHLIGARAGGGDVGASMQASRRTLLASSADGFSPVLYLRGSDRGCSTSRSGGCGRRRPGRPGAGTAADGELPPACGRCCRGRSRWSSGRRGTTRSTVEIRARLREGPARGAQDRRAGRGARRCSRWPSASRCRAGGSSSTACSRRSCWRCTASTTRRRSSTPSRRTCGPACTRRCCGCRCSSTRSPGTTRTSRCT